MSDIFAAFLLGIIVGPTIIIVTIGIIVLPGLWQENKERKKIK